MKPGETAFEIALSGKMPYSFFRMEQVKEHV